MNDHSETHCSHGVLRCLACVEQSKRTLTLDQAINLAAETLPEGWNIEINVERGAGWVELYNEKGRQTPFTESGTLSEQVQAAIEYAKTCRGVS